MDKKNKNFTIYYIVLVLMLLFFVVLPPAYNEVTKIFSNKSDVVLYKSNELNIISSSENKDIEDIIFSYANSKGYKVNIDYAGTLDITDKLNQGEKYDVCFR